ncbi:MAG: hypothetical protein IH991_09675 [Planctomycetes bacterium]|nr:hypothetical protein [Planctomycetota bacterium]
MPTDSNWPEDQRLFTFERYGESANMVSYELTFWFVGLVTLSLLLLLLLFLVKPSEVDRTP